VSPRTTEVARYAYDPLGRRVEKLLPGPEVHTYVYDGEDILWQDFTSLIMEAGMPDPAPHLYIHGPGIDEPLAVEHGNGAIWYYHSDGLGSVVRATDYDGDIVHTRRYDAFGQPQEGAELAGYAYTGREWDPETGLYYYRGRYYDPKIGIFISEDPIGFEGGINLFTYVKNDPVNWVDPLGLKAGDRYRNRNRAAKAAMKEIYPLTLRRDEHGWYSERCGNICRIEGGFTYDEPETGSAGPSLSGAGLTCDPKPKCPDESDPVADYHSHPPGGWEGPSPDDKTGSNLPPPLGRRRMIYVVSAPSGNMYKWNTFKQSEEYLGCVVK
jgi:RHS repeat-associated protein